MIKVKSKLVYKFRRMACLNWRKRRKRLREWRSLTIRLLMARSYKILMTIPKLLLNQKRFTIELSISANKSHIGRVRLTTQFINTFLNRNAHSKTLGMISSPNNIHLDRSEKTDL